LRTAEKNWRLSAIISEPKTTATSSGKAPGATAKTLLTVELASKPSMSVTAASLGAIQEAAAQSCGIATGIDPGVIHPGTIEDIPPALSMAYSRQQYAILPRAFTCLDAESLSGFLVRGFLL
jgi:hypothetical protein